MSFQHNEQQSREHIEPLSQSRPGEHLGYIGGSGNSPEHHVHVLWPREAQQSVLQPRGVAVHPRRPGPVGAIPVVQGVVVVRVVAEADTQGGHKKEQDQEEGCGETRRGVQVVNKRSSLSSRCKPDLQAAHWSALAFQLIWRNLRHTFSFLLRFDIQLMSR